MPEPVSVADPGGVAKAYARLLTGARRPLPAGRRGHARTGAGRLAGADERGADRGPRRGGGAGALVRRRAAAARLPHPARRQARLSHALQGRRQRHAQPPASSTSSTAMRSHPMVKGIRLTTGAEFALRDAPPTPVQLAQVEPLARSSSRWARGSMRSRGSGAARACPTCCRWSDARPSTRGCGSTSATTTWASRWARSPVACWRR